MKISRRQPPQRYWLSYGWLVAKSPNIIEKFKKLNVCVCVPQRLQIVIFLLRLMGAFSFISMKAQLSSYASKLILLSLHLSIGLLNMSCLGSTTAGYFYGSSEMVIYSSDIQSIGSGDALQMAFLRAEIILSQKTSSLSSLDRSYTLVIRLGRGIEAMTKDWRYQRVGR